MLSIVSTPIGNLRDMTLRGLDVLKEADIILCEDTRQSKKLLDHFEIENQLVSYHEHSTKDKTEKVLQGLRSGMHYALISDGGMPILNDPGYEIYHQAVMEGLETEILPGASAVPTALTGSGLAVDQFSFFGFLPPKSARRKRMFESLQKREETLIFFESPHRIKKTVHEAFEVLGDREAVIAREMTKKFEEFIRGNLSDLKEVVSKRNLKGEIVFLISGFERKKMFQLEKA